MSHVITELCLRDGGCVAVCPVACIVPGKPQEKWPLYYIDPNTCIDCGACVPECPHGAIFPKTEVPDDYIAGGYEILSAPLGTARFDKEYEAFTYEGEPVKILAARKTEAGEHIDLTPAIQTNREFFESGPGYLSVD
ncbi:MAG: ferredoxin family protein [Chloroflexi bacterium]|nr:ferredoxin family protein [Chloroflexota bacterium]